MTPLTLTISWHWLILFFHLSSEMPLKLTIFTNLRSPCHWHFFSLMLHVPAKSLTLTAIIYLHITDMDPSFILCRYLGLPIDCSKITDIYWWKITDIDCCKISDSCWWKITSVDSYKFILIIMPPLEEEGVYCFSNVGK